MNYQKMLHDVVNGFPVIEICPLACLTDPQGNLILQRGRGETYWKLPGGFLDPDEAITKCLQRNVLENYGVLIENSSLLKIFSGPEYTYISDDSARIYPIYMLFLPTSLRGSLRTLPKDGAEMRFFAPWNVPIDRVFPPMRKAVQYFIDTFSGGTLIESMDLERLQNVAD